MAHRARSAIKDTLKITAKKSMAVAGAALRAQQPRSVTLTYHSIGKRDHAMNVAPAAFREQMEWLASTHRVINAEEAVAAEEGVAITFDDGYRDNLTHVAPILNRFNLPAIVFVVAGRAGARLDHDGDLAHAELMTWDEISQLSAAGIDIGGHSMTHPHLAELDEPAQREEIATCKSLIEERLGKEVAGFAYPFGSARDFTDTSRRLVRECGYRYGLSNQYGPNRQGADPWACRRIWIDRTDTLASFQAKVDGRLDMLSFFETGLGLGLRRSLNRVLGIR